MKISIVCPYAWDRFGGVQSHVRELARGLSDRGHAVGVFAPVASSRSPLERAVTAVGRTVPVPVNGSMAPISFGPLGAARLRRATRAFAPEILHVHEPLIPSSSLLAILQTDVPVVGTFHASAPSSRGYKLAAPVLRRVLDKIAFRTVVSDAARDLIARYFPGEYMLTPNGVDVGRFAEAEPLELPGKRGKVVLFLGRLEQRKGLEVLIRAMAHVRDLDTTLVVAGGGPHEGRCRSLAESLQVPATFLGRLEDRDVPRAYRAADVYCAPGLSGESFGIVLLEAMAAGAPVVCSDLPGFRAVAGEAAVLSPPGDAGALAGALRRVLSDDSAAARLEEAGRRRAAMFDWSRLIAGVEALYRRAAGEGS